MGSWSPNTADGERARRRQHDRLRRTCASRVQRGPAPSRPRGIPLLRLRICPARAIELTWTAVYADLIARAQILPEEGESHAKDLVAGAERAQAGVEAEAIPIMLTLEKALLDKLELIDFTQREQRERTRDDRHLRAHRPSDLLASSSSRRRSTPPPTSRPRWKSCSSPRAKAARSLKVSSSTWWTRGCVYDTAYLTHTFFDRAAPVPGSRSSRPPRSSPSSRSKTPRSRSNRSGSPTAWPSACAASLNATPRPCPKSRRRTDADGDSPVLLLSIPVESTRGRDQRQLGPQPHSFLGASPLLTVLVCET